MAKHRKGRNVNGTGSIYQDSKGYWNAETIDGKKFRSREQAIVVEKKREWERLHGTGERREIVKIRLDEYMETFIVSKKKLELKPSSYDRTYRTFQTNIKPTLGKYQLTKINADIIQDKLVKWMIDSGYSYSSIHKSYVILNECMKYAVIKGVLSSNPCMGVSLPNRKNIAEKEIRFFDDEEIARFVSQANSPFKTTGKPNRYRYGAIITLIIYTGMRGGELCGLKWEDIDFENETITVKRNTTVAYEYNDDSKVRNVIEQASTKSKSRIIPMSRSAREILTKWREHIGGNNGDYVVNGCSDIVAVDALSNAFTNIANAADISNPLGIHTLRHTCASMLIRKGVDIKVVSEILGHSSVAFTYNTYVHLIQAQKISAMNLLDDI